ncbi:MAG: hypothetical protein Q9160_001186 [Pyrenula sp. 1 TL-2023]
MDHYRSSRLVFRGVNPEDDPFFETLTQDSELVANASPFLLVPPNKKNAEEFRQFLSERCRLGVIICLPGTTASSTDGVAKPTPIGQLTIMKGPPGQEHHRQGSIGISILAAYQRKGYGTEAIEWALNWAFQIAGLHRVAIGQFSYNPDAGKLYRKMGFIQEGVQREALWWNGGWHDINDMSMLEHEWRERQRSNGTAEGKGKN